MTDDAPNAIGEEAPRWRLLTQRCYDPDRDGELTASIVFAIADAACIPASEVSPPPLYDVIDVSAVENLLFNGGPRDSSEQLDTIITFHYLDYLLSIRSDGRIAVYE